jgi:GntR family transcriptional regulator
MAEETITLSVSSHGGVAPYMQLIQQVRHALRLGTLVVGDQLPTVKEVAAMVAVNPNTVLKAYRELEYEGLVEARPGRGTFVTALPSEGTVAAHKTLRRELDGWLGRAREAGLDDEGIEALFTAALRDTAREQRL